VRQSLGLLDRGVRQARSLDAPERGPVQVAAVATAAEHLLLPLVGRFRQQHPQVGVSVHVGNRTTVWEALRDHWADLVIAGRPPGAVPARVLATAPNRLVVAGPPRPETEKRRADLGQQTWLLREAGSGTRGATDELLAELGIAPRTMILGSNGAITQAIGAGLGVALISLDAVADRVADGTASIWPCPGTPLNRPWHVVAHSSNPLSVTAILLVRSMVEADDRLALTAEGRRALREARSR
jgi:DNA-binding transcriptional LysR family regulator